MTGCGCAAVEVNQEGQRRALKIALGLNATMFVVGLIAGVIAQSSGLLADALDMLADALAYGIALLAIERSSLFKARAATLSGTLLLVLGIGVLFDVARRGIYGSSPQSLVVIAVATVSLVVNSFVLYLLANQQSKADVNLRATYIFTRADVIANIAVIVSGAIVFFTGFRAMDLIVGAGIGLYVIREALEIFGEARAAQKGASR